MLKKIINAVKSEATVPKIVAFAVLYMAVGKVLNWASRQVPAVANLNPSSGK